MPKVSVLCVYNAYLNRGGEDEVFEAEAALLEKQGHVVHRLRIEADELKAPPLLKQPLIAVQTVWSRRYYDRFRRLARELRPAVAHFHNTFPLLSPAAYVACRAEGLAVVQTLHNYRLVCPKSTLFRDGHPCEDCVGKTVPWPGVLHACYHESMPQTAVVASMLALHRLRRTWDNDIHVYVAPTQFARRKFIEGGLPPERIQIKGNFIDYDAGDRTCNDGPLLFVGRLDEHKGIGTVIETWQRNGVRAPLRIIGDGPMASEVARFAGASPNVEYLGRQTRERVLAEMKAARALIFPSLWYEGLPVTIVEAFASGLPVITGDVGPMGSELIQDGATGLVFTAGDPASLAQAAQQAWTDPETMARMGNKARVEYHARYTPQRNYERLLSIYDEAIARARAG